MGDNKVSIQQACSEETRFYYKATLFAGPLSTKYTLLAFRKYVHLFLCFLTVYPCFLNDGLGLVYPNLEPSFIKHEYTINIQAIDVLTNQVTNT